MIEWAQKIKKDQHNALKEIYHLYRSDCVAWLIKAHQLREDEALDVFQLSVIILYDNVCLDKVLSETVSLKSYLYSIARNKAMETLRKHKSNISTEEHGYLIAYIADEVPDLQQYSDIDLAIKSLDELGHPCSTVIRLFYYEKLNMEEITSKMGYNNANTTKNQKYKCLQRLQKIYFSHLNTDNKI